MRCVYCKKEFTGKPQEDIIHQDGVCLRGPTIAVSYKEDKPTGWLFKTDKLPDDIQEQIDRYDLHHPILAHHKTCRCFRCRE